MTSLPSRPPAAMVLAVVGAAWREVLDRADIGDEDDFFTAGGNSLHAVRIVARASEDLDVDLSVRAVLEARTIRGMVDRVLAELAAADAAAVAVEHGHNVGAGCGS